MGSRLEAVPAPPLALLLLGAAAAALLAAPGLAHEPGTIHLEVTAHEYHFETNKTSGENPKLELERGATYEVTFRNAGNVDHTFYLEDPVSKGTGSVSGDDQETITFRVPWDADDVSFQYWCNVGGHRGLGMEGNASHVGGNDAPDVTVGSPADGDVVQGEVTLSGHTSDPQDDALAVEVKAPPSGTWTEADGQATWAFDWDSTQVDDGNHTLQVRAVDDHGFANATEVTLQVANDRNQAPQVRFDAPPPTAEVSGVVAVNGTASDPDGDVASLELRIPPAFSTWRPLEGTGSWSFEWDTSEVDTGFYNVSVRAVDGENASTINRLPLEVVAESTNRAPRLTVSAPASGEAVEGEVRVAGNATDRDGDPVSVAVLPPTASDWQPADGPGGDGAWTHTWNASGLEPGEHTVRIRADDGQAAVHRNVTVTVRDQGNRGPTITFLEPERDEALRGPVTVLLEASDVDDGDTVESVRVRFAAQETFRQADARARDRWRVRLPTEGLDPGTARITAVASDGEAAGRAVLPVRVPEGPPDDAPTLNLSREPPDRAEGLVTLRGVVEDEHVQAPPLSVELRVGDDLEDFVERNQPGAFSLSWNARRTEAGVHDVAVQAIDGDAASDPVIFAVRVVGGADAQAADEGTFSTPSAGAVLAAVAGLAAAGIRPRP